jgi:DNA polymerase-1
VARVYLIDGSSQMYRAFHAPIRTTEGTPLRDAQGRPTNAVYIFVTMLRKLLKEHQPEFIAASFDLPGPTFRDDLAADYKANRRPMPEDLAQQIPLVHDACEALGVPILTSERYEADDVIGTLAQQAAAAGFEVAIVTGDKDFFQLVGDGIKVFNPKEEGAWFDANAVKEKFGVAPEQVVDVLALMGDTIDNIKGVPGIGEKGARDLIAEYGSLEALLARAADIPQKRYREPLLAHRESARQSRELARIRTDVPVTFSVDAVRYRGASRQRAFELFSRLVFRSLVAEYAPTAETSDRDYRLVTASELPALAAELKEAERVALRVIPGDPAAMRAPIVGIAFSTAERQARYVPIGHHALGPTGNVSLERVAAALGPVLADPAVKKVGHDLKFDAILLERHGLALNGLETDTLILSYLLDATRSAHRLEDLSLEHAGYKALTEEEVCGRGAKALPFGELPADGLLDYAGERADVALRVAGPLRDLVAREALQDLYQSLELPLVPVLVAIERAGVRIDAAALLSQSQRIDQELASRSRQIFEIAGEEFNINSPPQLSLILFEKLSLPVLKRNIKTKTPSTAVEVLEELALAHDLPRLILEWRTLQKLKGTYIDALPQLVNPATGRVHTCFNQAVAATGRLSSSDPNLQNIPIRTELGREIRRAFVAEPGFVLISADYSQIELRVLAHMSGDEALIDAFERGKDIHDRTALKVFGAASGLSRHELRSRAKMINYAVLYGKTAFTLAKDISVSQQAAQEFIDAYFAGFPGVRRFIDETLARARETASVKTMMGRRRLVPDLNSRNGQIRAAAERAATNFPIQGSAADILKRAMIDVHAALPSGRARMILTVHDELLFEARKEAAEEVGALVRERMEKAVPLRVPVTVDLGIGENWKEAKG